MSRLFVVPLLVVALGGCAFVHDLNAHINGGPTMAEQRELDREEAERERAARVEADRQRVEREAAERRDAAAIDAQNAALVHALGGMAPCDGATLILFSDKAQVSMGIKPQSGCAYSLSQMKAMQKVPGGYLITDGLSSFGEHPYGLDLLYLETKAEIPAGELIGGYAKYIGKRNYTALDGYEHSVFAFKVVTPK